MTELKKPTQLSTPKINVPEIKEEPISLWYDKSGPKIVRFLQSKFFAISVAVILTLLQTTHPAKVMYSFGIFDNPIVNGIYSYAFSLLIEFFVMYYVVAKDVDSDDEWYQNVSAYFAIFSIVINLYFYISTLGISHDGVFNFKIVPACAFALIIPISIYRISENILKK